ncbi:MAG: OmpA family protein [Thermoanaerobaculia bacterium]|nr:OmpA family protein [Thermoanaerobaculia bacterium]
MKKIRSQSVIYMIVVVMVAALAGGCISADDPNKRAKQGAIIGAATGAAAGAVIGNQSGNKEKGAAIGAVAGAGVGAAVGHMMDKQQRELEEIEGVDVTRPAEDELAVVMENDILFDFDSHALRSTSRSTLRELSGVLVDYPETDIVVKGHTDSVGSDTYNQALSVRRARAVRDFLMSHGVVGSRISALGLGESMPVASNETVEGRQLNRRVEVEIIARPQAGG